MVGIRSLLTFLLAVSSTMNSAELLTKSLVIERLGFTLHYPESWSGVAQDDHAWMVNAPLEQATGSNLDSLAQIFVTTEHRTNHAEAVNRLREICSEYQIKCTYLAIGGWPAMQREVIVPKEQPGAEEAPANQEMILQVTTAIAAGDLLIRTDGRMAPSVSERVKTQVRAIENGTSLRVVGNPKETPLIRELQRNPRLTPFSPPPSKVQTSSPPRQSELNKPRVVLRGGAAQSEGEQSSGGPKSTLAASSAGAGAPGIVIKGGFASEPEIAVSTNGLNIVVAQQFAYATSNDGGTTFPYTGNFTSSTGGDSSLAYGKSGNFYEGTISTSSTALNLSINNGQTFAFQTNAFTCPATGPNQCGFNSGPPNSVPFPDQEHIAADRYNRSSSGGDQVYFVWRQGNGNVGIACSTTSGTNFGNPTPFSGDFPRITVGQDGFVYVVYITGSPNSGNINLNKFSSCQNGLSAQTGFPATVASGIGVTCPVAGLDRCNNGNVLGSQMVAVDDTNANHVYVSYAQSSGNGESVVLQDSGDGGKTWPSNRAVTLSASSTARRFMPWLCTGNGVANVPWYDRRSATGSQNDLTDYYGANACVQSSGNLTSRSEFQLNAPNSADAECLAGKNVGSGQSWPAGSRALGDSTTCSEQPELGGQCSQTKGNCNLAGTNTCPNPGETCQTVANGGVPKYGDYNGNACAAGTLFTVWASATPPPGTAATGNVDLDFASNLISVTKNCTACGRSGNLCCTGNKCTTGLVCQAGNCAACGASGDPCCAGNKCTAAGLVCQAGACGAQDVFTASPSSLFVQAGDGTTGANAASTNLIASGYWAGDPDVSPSLDYKVIQPLPPGVAMPPPGAMPPGISRVITNDINPPTVKFTAGTNTTPGVYTIAITGTIGQLQATALVTLTVVACQPLSCAQAGWSCGSFDNECGANSSCGTCASGNSCVAGSCYATCNKLCEPPEFLNPIACSCESCQCGYLTVDGHRLCAACKPVGP
jgi:hypothetical protein